MEQITTIKNDLGVVMLFGALDRIQDSMDLQNKTKELIEQKVSHIILDLTEVLFITASFCGYLMGVGKELKSRGIKFSIVASENSKVSEIFSIIGFLSKQEILGVYNSLKACFIMNKIQNNDDLIKSNNKILVQS